MKLRFIRFNKNVKIPERAHYSDTGADIFMPVSGKIEPLCTTVIPLGFGIDVPNGYTANIQARTSIAKSGLMLARCAIDAGYTGEINMIIHNISHNTFCWSAGDRLGYIEVYPTQYPEFVEDLVNEREANAFGSTGK